MSDLLKRGKKGNITKDDIQAIEDHDMAMGMAEAILAEWKRQESTGKKSLIRVIFKVFGPRYMTAGILFFIELIVQLGQGYCLANFLEWIALPNGVDTTGYIYATGIAVTGLMYAVLHHAEWFICQTSGMRVRVGLIGAIYQKCLNLSLADTSSTGFIINLVSNDVQRFEDCSPFLHYLWITPLQMIGFMALIYMQIGYSVFAAIGSLFLLLVIQYGFSPFFKKYRRITVNIRDERIKTLSDMLAGISVVKLYAWEIPFVKKILDLRNSELKFIWKGSVLKSINEAVFFLSSIVINGITFTTFVWLGGGQLTPARVFSTVIYLNVLKLSITRFIPACAQFIPEALVSAKRIEEFLSLPDVQLQSSVAAGDISSDLILELKNASFSWDASQSLSRTPILKSLDLQIKRGDLTMVVGQVGSGKSSLLGAILNDMAILEGDLKLNTSEFAYVSQTAFILSGTIQDNITFGKEFIQAKFDKVIEVCALERDMELFPKGPQTFVGERGVTLSGGQKARVSLARAVYSEAELYLFDDPLSAVDTKVARHIFEKCINGYLKEKTVILVTHQMQYLSNSDKVVVMIDGKIAQQGSFEEILSSKSDFAATIENYTLQLAVEQQDGAEDNGNEDEIKLMLKEAKAKEENFQKEDVFTGGVTVSTYWQFFRTGASVPTFIFLFVLSIVAQAVVVASDFWLASWSSLSSAGQRDLFYTLVFVGLAVASVLMVLLRAYMFFRICIWASKASFEKMLQAVFGSAMSFFQANPHGRTMNRFSKDINIMDESLPQTFFDLIQCLFYLVAVFVVSAIVVPYVLIIFPFLGYMFHRIQSYYLQTARQVKRLEAVSRSPVYGTIPSTLEGLAVIRAFGAKERFRKLFFTHQDENTRMFYTFLSGSRWLGFRLDAAVGFITGVAVFLIVILRAKLGLSAGLVGILTSYLIQMTGTLQWVVRQSSEVENMMVSAERVFEYSRLPSEEKKPSAIKPPSSWPENGAIELKGMSLTYPNIQNSSIIGNRVLKDLRIKIEPGTKIGVVGRTGAGKSSLIQALFRIVEPSPEKSILIDDIYTSDLSLVDLRSSLSIIPQEPFCFKGTIRFNLDPFNSYTDDDLWRVLEKVELKTTIANSPDKLDEPVAENGSNWSVGERQLICLARAILVNTKLIVMDEATSSVDLQTDRLIQAAIRHEFETATVLTIAHRLETIIDYDKILVLEAGEIVEYGSPKDLLSKPISTEDAWFARMVHELGPEAEQNLKSMIKSD